METVEQLLGARPETTESLLGPRPIPEPAPFDLDGQVNKAIIENPEWNATHKERLAQTLWPVVRPFMAQGYNAMAALNRGVSVLAEHLDTISEMFEGIPVDFYGTKAGKRGGLFKNIADFYELDSKRWAQRAKEVGINFMDELISEAVGGAAPGIAEFMLGVPYSALLGASEGVERGENPIVGALVEGAKRYSLGQIFRAIEPLKVYLKAPVMGGVMGVQTALEGGDTRDIAKNVGIGGLYAVTSPGGVMGLNEVKAGLKKIRPIEAPKIPEADVLPIDPKVKEIVENKPRLTEGLPEAGEPQTSPRKYWETVAEAERTAPESKRIMKEIQTEEPQINIVQPNRASLEQAYKTVEEKGFDESLKYVRESKDLKPVEKGALFNVLMEKSQQVGDWAKFTEIMDSYSLYLADLGRGVQIASVWSRTTPMGFIKWAEKQLEGTNKKYGWFDTILGRKKAVLTDEDKVYISQKMGEMNKMPEGAEKSAEMLKLIDYVAIKVPPSVSEMIDAFRYQNMLSGPQTQERNIGYNMTATFIARPWELGMRGMIDYVQAGLRGKERQAYVSDAPKYLKTAINSVPNALMAFKASWQMKPGEEIGKPEIGIESRTQFQQARAKQIPKALTVVGRFMEASDKFNMALIGSGEYAILKKKGLSDMEAHQKAEDLARKYLLRDKMDPKDPTLSYFSKALKEVGVLMEAGRKAPVIGKPLSYVVPFLRTPINLGVEMIERSPLGWARGNLDLDAASKLAVGGGMTALGAIFSYLGETTWTAPTDEKEKQWFYASGRKPFSVKIGEKWIPFWYTGPYALAFAIPSAVKYYSQDSKESLTDDQIEKLGKIAAGIAKFLASQTSAQSIGNFFSYMNGDIDYNFNNQFGFLLGQVIPAEAMIRYVNKAIDPVMRKPEGIYEQVIKDIPVLSKELPARMTPFMEESRREFFNMFLPYDIGSSQAEYESMFPWIKLQDRMKYLDNKMKGITNKMTKGDFRDKHFDEMIKVFDAYPNVLKGISEEPPTEEKNAVR